MICRCQSKWVHEQEGVGIILSEGLPCAFKKPFRRMGHVFNNYMAVSNTKEPLLVLNLQTCGSIKSLARLLFGFLVFPQEVLDGFPKERGLRDACAQGERLDLFQRFRS
jgi:hypothetical protein